VNEVLGLSAIVMLVLLFLKVPVYLSVLGGSAIYFVLNPSINTVMFAQRAITGVESISLLAIPFFVCAGILMNYTGVTFVLYLQVVCQVVWHRLTFCFPH